MNGADLTRSRSVTRTRFSDGAWGHRVEILSFASIPQQSVLLVAAAAAALVARALAGDAPVDVWLERAIRAIAGTGLVAMVLAGLGVVWAVVSGSGATGEFTFVISRLGGMGVA